MEWFILVDISFSCLYPVKIRFKTYKSIYSWNLFFCLNVLSTPRYSWKLPQFFFLKKSILPSSQGLITSKFFVQFPILCLGLGFPVGSYGGFPDDGFPLGFPVGSRGGCFSDSSNGGLPGLLHLSSNCFIVGSQNLCCQKI